MREVFSSVGDLMGYYQYLKLNVASISSTSLKRDDEGTAYNAMASRSRKEEKLCMIADVEKFVKEYSGLQVNNSYVPIPVDCLDEIFMFTFCERIRRHDTLGKVAMFFAKKINRGERLPRRLKYRQHIHAISQDFRNKAKAYYQKKGLIQG